MLVVVSLDPDLPKTDRPPPPLQLLKIPRHRPRLKLHLLIGPQPKKDLQSFDSHQTTLDRIHLQSIAIQHRHSE
jgi:hypothetical protein